MKIMKEDLWDISLNHQFYLWDNHKKNRLGEIKKKVVLKFQYNLHLYLYISLYIF